MIKNLFNKIYGYVRSKHSIDTVTPIFRPDVVQEDPRDQQAVKRVRAAFDAQQIQMQTRALKKHGSDCIDILNCKKDICFVGSPDQMVGGVYTVDKKTRKRVD